MVTTASSGSSVTWIATPSKQTTVATTNVVPFTTTTGVLSVSTVNGGLQGEAGDASSFGTRDKVAIGVGCGVALVGAAIVTLVWAFRHHKKRRRKEIKLGKQKLGKVTRG